jgi:hypothetical protein
LDWQTVTAIALAAAAALWLARRWWRRGFDEEEQSCSGCSAVTPLAAKRTGSPTAGRPPEKPVEEKARRERAR